jgi:hypothetical protein
MEKGSKAKTSNNAAKKPKRSGGRRGAEASPALDDPPEVERGPRYRRPEDINQWELTQALDALALVGDDMFMRMQAFNLSVVDPFIMNLEAEVLRLLLEEDHAPVPESAFLLAQSQMWIFAVYELLRTWRQRVTDILDLHKNGGLELKAAALETKLPYQHFAREMRAKQLRRVVADPSLIDPINDDLRRTHMLFARIETLRVSIAKHEVSGRPKAVAFRPGYGRINQWCGSLDFELENGRYIMGYISRRDIADDIRALANPGRPLPDDKTLKEFDDYMRGVEPPDFGSI